MLSNTLAKATDKFIFPCGVSSINFLKFGGVEHGVRNSCFGAGDIIDIWCTDPDVPKTIELFHWDLPGHCGIDWDNGFNLGFLFFLFIFY